MLSVRQNQLPFGWEAKVDPVSQRFYYVNHINRSSQWEEPQLTMATPAATPAAVAPRPVSPAVPQFVQTPQQEERVVTPFENEEPLEIGGDSLSSPIGTHWSPFHKSSPKRSNRRGLRSLRSLSNKHSDDDGIEELEIPQIDLSNVPSLHDEIVAPIDTAEAHNDRDQETRVSLENSSLSSSSKDMNLMSTTTTTTAATTARRENHHHNYNRIRSLHHEIPVIHDEQDLVNKNDASAKRSLWKKSSNTSPDKHTPFPPYDATASQPEILQYDTALSRSGSGTDKTWGNVLGDRIQKKGGLIKGLRKSFTRFVGDVATAPDKPSHADHVTLNGYPLNPDQIHWFWKRYGIRIRPDTHYWYDVESGFFGKQGGRAKHTLDPGLAEIRGAMHPRCSHGDSGIQLNGREIPAEEKLHFQALGIPLLTLRSYRVHGNGDIVQISDLEDGLCEEAKVGNWRQTQTNKRKTRTESGGSRRFSAVGAIDLETVGTPNVIEDSDNKKQRVDSFSGTMLEESSGAASGESQTGTEPIPIVEANEWDGVM